MTKKFKSGDRVYHKHLKQFGTFVQYNTLRNSDALNNKARNPTGFRQWVVHRQYIPQVPS